MYVLCDYCSDRHVAEPAHVSETQGQIYAVVCTADDPIGLTDYYTAERVELDSAVQGKWSTDDQGNDPSIPTGDRFDIPELHTNPWD